MGTAFKILPLNYLRDFGEFESWSLGTGSAPDGWLKATSPTLAREATNFKFGVYGALIIGSTGAGVGGIYTTVPDGDDYAGRTFKLGVWAKSASTGPYIELNDGVTSKTVHLDGLNAFVFVTTPSMKLDSLATQIRINLFASQNATAYFDSAVLCEGEDLFTSLDDTNIAINKWQPSMSMKQDQYEISQKEGSFIPDNHMQGKTVRMSGTVVGSDAASTRTNLDNLAKALLDHRTTQMKHLYLYDDRVLDVFLKSFDWDYKNSLKFIDFNFQFSAQDVTTRYLNKLRSRSVIAASVTEFNIAYNGNTETRPFISFVADQGTAITTCSLKNLTTGETIAITGTVPSGVAMNVDCLNGTVFNSSVNAVGQFGVSDFIRMVKGTNYFKFSGSNCTILIDYFERYL